MASKRISLTENEIEVINVCVTKTGQRDWFDAAVESLLRKVNG